MDGNRSAFPFAEMQTFDEDKGLTKRELLAAMAMQGMISAGWDSGDTKSVDGWRDQMAHEAVRYADALLEALT